MESENGMYVIDDDYRVLFCNETVREMYPEMEKGQYCYQALGHRNNICPYCPRLGVNKRNTFYNSSRDEWIHAQLAEADLPEIGRGFVITFSRTQENKRDDKQDLFDRFYDNDHSGMIGGYCEEGFPLYFANQKMLEMMGYDDYEEFRAEIKGMVANAIHPDDMEQVMRDLGTSYYPGKEYVTTYRMSRRDGSWFWIVDRGRVVEAEDGRLAIVSVCKDISDAVQAQKQLEEQNELLQQQNKMMEFMNDGMPGGYHRCASNPAFPFLHISSKFLKMTGYTRQEIRELFQDKLLNLVHPDDRIILESAASTLMTGMKENQVSVHYRLCTKQGYIWVVDTTRISEYRGEKFFQGVIIDVSQEERMRQHIKSMNVVQDALREALDREQKYRLQLKDALEKAKEASNAKSSFLFNMSHDIRTPMNAIIGFTQIAKRNMGNTAKVEDCLNKIEVSGNQLLQLLNDVLDLARIENGKIEFEEKECDITEHLREMCVIFQSEVDNHQLTLVTDFTGLGDCKVYCDTLRLNRVLMNLLSNAIKYTPKGGHVWLTAGSKPSGDEDKVEVTISVKDEGIGMSEQFLDKLFNEFERERTSTESRHQGTGLGLAIAKKIIDAAGGTIQVISEQGKGSEFIVSVQFRKAERVNEMISRNEEEIPDFTGKRALLVEDNELNREIAKEIIKVTGLMIEDAYDGSEAVRKFSDSPTGYYDLILMDVQMPIMDGYEATRRIRRLVRRDASTVPIIAMTANAFSEDVKKALRAGMNGHVSKPIDIQSLAARLKKYLS